MSHSVDHLFPEIAGSGCDADRLKPRRKNGLTNSRTRRTVLAVGGVLLCIFFVLLYIPLVRITPGNFARIQRGMTQKQVEAILGGPPGHYDGVGVLEFPAGHPPDKERGLEWSAIDGDVYVVFDGNGCVFNATFYPSTAISQDLWSFVVERITRCRLSSWHRWWCAKLWPGTA